MHLGAAGDDVLECQGAAAASLLAGDFAGERPRRHGVAQRYGKPLEADRLDDEIDGAGPHGGDDTVDAAMGGLDDDWYLEPGLAHSAEHAETIEFRHNEIKHDAIIRALGRKHGR